MKNPSIETLREMIRAVENGKSPSSSELHELLYLVEDDIDQAKAEGYFEGSE